MRQTFVQTLGPSNDVLEAVRRGQPALIKVVDPDAGWVQALHEASPRTLIIGRLVEDHQGRLVRGEGQAFARRVMTKADEIGLIEVWEGSNEAISGGMTDMHRLTDFEYAFAEALNDEGLKPLVGGFSTGVPEIEGDYGEAPWMDEWEVFYPAMQIAWGVHFHEHWHPHQLDDRWNAYRYQKWWPALPDWAKEKWWLISELGIDGGLAGHGRSGWMIYQSVEKYLRMLSNYDTELRDYPRMAASVFMAGLGVDRSWMSFDVAGTDVLPVLAEGWKANKDYKWGAEEPKAMKQVNLVGKLKVHPDKVPNRRHLSSINTYVIHHFGFDSRPPYDEVIKRVAEKHVNHNNWPVIAYTRVIDPDGTIYLTNELETISPHAGSRYYNDRGLSIALMCACHEHAPTDAQVEALKWQIVRWDTLDEIPGQPAIKSHREVREGGYTECPGDSVIALIPTLRAPIPPQPPTEDEWAKHLREASAIMVDAIEAAIAGAGQSTRERDLL